MQKTAYEMRISDWSSDVCSSDLSGPGTFGATGTVQASQSLGGNVSRMLAKGPTMRSRGGFSRGPDEPTPAELRAPNLWLLDYREGGTFCVLDPAVLMLWRPNMQGDTALEIESGGKKTTVRSEEHTSELQSLMRNSYAV